MPRSQVYLQLVEELEKLASDRLELSQARGLNELPSMIVGADVWDEASLEELLRLASCCIPDTTHRVKGRRKAARLALGVEPGSEKSLKEAALAMGRSTREAQPSRRLQLSALWGDLAIALLELSYETLRPSDQVEVLTDDGDVAASLINYIKNEHPRTLRFLELSAASVSPVLASAIQSLSDCKIQLLVADPRMLSPFHWKKRMLPVLQRLELAFNEFQGNTKSSLSIEARCYGFYNPPETDPPPPSAWPDALPSFRGRNFDDGLLSIGWYSYAPVVGNLQAPKSPAARVYPVREVWGHFNPVIMARPDDSGFAALKSFFDQQFEAIWSGRKDREIPPAASLYDAVAVRDKESFVELQDFLMLLNGKE